MTTMLRVVSGRGWTQYTLITFALVLSLFERISHAAYDFTHLKCMSHAASLDFKVTFTCRIKESHISQLDLTVKMISEASIPPADPCALVMKNTWMNKLSEGNAITTNTRRVARSKK